MIKKFIALAVCLAILFCNYVVAFAENKETSSGAKNNTEYDFKKFVWGDTEETVMAVEGEPLQKGNMKAAKANFIVYKGSIAGKDAYLAYYFCDDGLYEARYILIEEHSNENLFIKDYEDIRTVLTKRFGDPTFDFENWQDDSKKSYYSSKKGDALSYGYLSYETYYLMERSVVGMDMSADNYDITTTISFQSLNIIPEESNYADDF